jgi:membrane protein required for colicin V production
MNWVDLAIVSIVALSALVGLARGLVREALAVAMWACALLVAWAYFPQVEGYLRDWISAGSVRMATAFLTLVLLVLAAGSLFGHLLTRLVERSGLTGTDRLLGGLFGTVRGGLIVAMSVFLVSLTPLPEDAWWKDSALIGRFQALAERLLGDVPPEVAERIKYL